MTDTQYILGELKIEVTHNCPLQCIHCSSESSTANVTEMIWNDFEKISSEANLLNVKEIAFSGGEPLTWTRIFDAVSVVSQNGIKTILYSSGNIPNIQNVFQRLKDSKLNTAIFSMYGSSKGFHEKITRVKGSFQHTINAIKACISTGIECEIHFVPMSVNYRELSRVADLAKQLGISKTSVLRLVPQGRAAANYELVLSHAQNMELRKIILSLRETGHDIRLGSPYNSLLLTQNPKCYSGVDRLTIGPDLRIFPCDAFKHIGPVDLGVSAELSSLKKCSLLESWKDSPFLNKVRSYLSSDYPDECSECNFLPKCNSGCVAQKYYQHGYLAKTRDPMCMAGKL